MVMMTFVLEYITYLELKRQKEVEKLDFFSFEMSQQQLANIQIIDNNSTHFDLFSQLPNQF